MQQHHAGGAGAAGGVPFNGYSSINGGGGGGGVSSLNLHAQQQQQQQAQPHAAQYSNGTSTTSSGASVLLSMFESGDWAGALGRIASHPSEVKSTDEEGRTPLHLACDHDAPAVVVQAITKAWPPAATTLSGESNMTPLHLLCSSSHASVHVVRVLIELGSKEQFVITDLDGDSALHTACRCGAPLEVLDALLRAYPKAVEERDLEGLTPLLRLWVRYFVTLGDDAIQTVSCKADLQNGELGEAWNKTELLLKTLYLYNHYRRHRTLNNATQQEQQLLQHQHPPYHQNHHVGEFPFVVHAAAGYDCPRPIVKMAAKVYPEQMSRRDWTGCTPLSVAAKAPIFKVRDLSEVGFSLEDAAAADVEGREYGYDQDEHGYHTNKNEETEDNDDESQPSVLEILLKVNTTVPMAGASVPDLSTGRLPLHWALYTKKRWKQGIRDLVEIYPEGLACPDPVLELFPFQLAAVTLTPHDAATLMGGTTTNTRTQQRQHQRPQDPDLTTIYELLRSNPSLLTKSSSPRRPRPSSNNVMVGTNP